MSQLFDKMLQPKVENPEANATENKNQKPNGYNQNEQKNLDRLIEITIEE